MKTKLALDVFRAHILPSLEAKHADTASLQKAINDGFDLFQVDKDGKEQPVEFNVVEQKSKDATAAPADLSDETITKLAKAIAKESKPETKAAPVGNIEVKPAFMDGLKMYKSLKSFTGNEAEKKRKAYAWGCFMLGGVMGMKKYEDRLKEHFGIAITKAQSEGINTEGGILVPADLQSYIIDLREQYGVYRRNVRVAKMTRDTQEFPRRVSGLTASFKGEAEALVESSKAWDSVSLTAKKLTALAKMSSELMEDAIINVGDDLASEIGYAFEKKIDECGFLGDGTTTYGGIHGASPRLKAIVGATTTSAGGVIVATGNLMSEVTLADLNSVVAALPQYADTANAKWYCHRYFWANVMERLARAAGGVTSMEIRGSMVKSFFGYQVEITQTLPKTDTNSQILCLFGDLSLSSTFGDRREMRISVSDQVYWANDQVGVKGTERFDINNHDLGTATEAGPVVGLQSLNS